MKNKMIVTQSDTYAIEIYKIWTRFQPFVSLLGKRRPIRARRLKKDKQTLIRLSGKSPHQRMSADPQVKPPPMASIITS